MSGEGKGVRGGRTLKKFIVLTAKQQPLGRLEHFKIQDDVFSFLVVRIIGVGLVKEEEALGWVRA